MFIIALGLAIVMSLSLFELGSTIETLGFMFGVLLCLLGWFSIREHWADRREKEIVVGVAIAWIVVLPLMLSHGVTPGKIFVFVALSLIIHLAIKYRKRV